MSEKTKCCNRKCGWIGLESEHRQVRIAPDMTEGHCPVCDGNTFYYKLKPGEVQKPKTGDQLISLERTRQIKVKGYTAEHDDAHVKCELSIEAANAILCLNGEWGILEKHKGNRVQQLVVAGALIAAEIDRLQRAAQTPAAKS